MEKEIKETIIWTISSKAEWMSRITIFSNMR